MARVQSRSHDQNLVKTVTFSDGIFYYDALVILVDKVSSCNKFATVSALLVLNMQQNYVLGL